MTTASKPRSGFFSSASSAVAYGRRCHGTDRDLSMSKNSATICPPRGSMSVRDRVSCQPRDDSGSWLSSVETRLARINETATATGDDPEPDTLLLRLHTETACRRSGALALRPDDLDPDQC